MMTVQNSEFTPDSNRSSSYSAALKQSPSDSLTQQTAAPLREATQIALQVPLDEDETKELLLCALYIFKNLEQGTNKATEVSYYENLYCLNNWWTILETAVLLE